MTVNKKKIPYSYKRLNDCARVIRGKHIVDALKEAEKIDKKGGPIIVTLLKQAKLDAKQKEYNLDMLYVHQAYVGGGYRSKKIEFKGRGKLHSTLLLII